MISNNAILTLERMIREPFPEKIPHGDMPGDKVKIREEHVHKAIAIYPVLKSMIANKSNRNRRTVVSVFGGSGVGKSETASLLSYALAEEGIKSYVLSGDNYAKRIPMYNDAERMRIFRTAGLKGMLEANCYTQRNAKALGILWQNESDSRPAVAINLPWLEIYQKSGRVALSAYLGSNEEQGFEEINYIVDQFISGKDKIWLKRMGRTEDERWYSQIDFHDVDVMIIEWTHGGNPCLQGIDIRIMLNSTPEETLAHRRARARDGKIDSAFTTMVLEIEQLMLQEQGRLADIMVSKTGELIMPEAHHKK